MLCFPGKPSLALRRCPYSSKAPSAFPDAYCSTSCFKNCFGVLNRIPSDILCTAPATVSGPFPAGFLPGSLLAAAGRLL